jgi:hypothetical protein
MPKEMTGKSEAMAQGPAGSKQPAGEARLNGKSPKIRYASDEQFQKAHHKTSALHAGLFRRLAE